MSIDLDRKMIHAMLATGDLVTFQQAGVTIDWLEDVGAKAAYQIVMEYAQDPRTAGTVPSLDYLLERGAYVPGAWNPLDQPQQLAEAMRVSRHKALNAKMVQEFVAANTSDPHLALEKFMEAVTAPEYEILRKRGRVTTLREMSQEVFKRYKDSVDVKGVTGIETPFPALTRSTKGWQRGDLYCCYAPKKSMKSFLMLLNGLRAWQTDPRHVLFITSEMPSEQLTSRLACMMYGWDFNAWRDRQLPAQIVTKLLTTDLDDRWHWYQPSGVGEQAIAEVRGQISQLNMLGGVSLVLWDGHYRSAASEEWTDVYSLVRSTRRLALDPSLLQPPIIVTSQEGSKKGQATHNAYGQEASLMMYVTKTAPDRLMLQTTAVREGPSVELEIGVSFQTMSFLEMTAQVEGEIKSQDDVGSGWK